MKFSFLFLLTFSCLVGYTQKYAVTPLAEFKGKGIYNKSDAVYYKGKIYSIDITGRRQLAYTASLEKTNFSVSLNQFDASGNLLKEVKLGEGEDIFGPITPRYTILNDNLYLLYFTYNNETGMSMHLSAVNHETAEAALSKPLISINQKNIGVLKLTKLLNDYNVEMNVSPDGNRMAFVFTTGLTNMYSYAVADKNIQVVYAGTGEVDGEKTIMVANTIVTNGGDFYATMRTRTMESKMHYLVQGKELNKKVKSIELAQDGHKIYSASVVTGSTASTVNVIGVCGEEKSPLISAMYTAPINTLTLAIGNVKQQDIPEPLIKQFSKDGYGGKKGLFAYAKFAAYTLDDGTSFLLSDASRIWMTANRTLNFKGNILLGTFSPNGSISVGFISKRETYGGSFYNAFFVHNAGDKIHIVYTDSQENLAKPVGEGALVSYNSKKDNNLVVASIDGSGRVNRNVIDSKSPQGYFFEPGYCTSISKHKFQLSLAQEKIGLNNITTKNFLSLVEIEQ